MTTPSVCVAICTHNRTDSLARLLHSLTEQSRRADQILVIDNAPSSTSTAQLIKTLENPAVLYALEPVPGLNFARNAALEKSETDIVAFIDDDAVPHEHWIATILEAFQHSEQPALCTGRVLPLMLDTQGHILFESNGGFDKGAAPVRVSDTLRPGRFSHQLPLIAWSFGLGVGCNLAVQRSIARNLGGFDPALDMGAAMPGGGDTDMIWRVLKAGHVVYYEPNAIVLHEHRASVEAAANQIVGHNKASMTMLAKSWLYASGVQRGSISSYIIWRLIKPGLRIIKRMCRKDPLPASLLLLIWRQCLLGLFAYPEARRQAAQRMRTTATTSETAETTK